jgi:hypothetical protein
MRKIVRTLAAVAFIGSLLIASAVPASAVTQATSPS